MSPLNERQILALAAKYLNIHIYKNTFSAFTARSYASDLSQFLQPLQLGQIIFQNEKWAVSQPEKSAGGTALVDIKKLIRGAQGRWASLSLASRNRKYACLKSFFHWLFEEGHVTEDFGTPIICPKVPRRVPHFLSLDEAISVVQYLKNAKKGEHKLRDLVLVLLLYGAGLRVSEAAGLKWSQVDLRSRTLTVLGKGGKERKVAVVQLLKEALAKMPHTGAYVFGKEALPTRKAYDIVRAAGASAGMMKPLHPHALRHSFATHMLSSGTDLRVLQELLGHESLTATEKYLHLSVEGLSRTMEKTHPLGNRKANL